jgi:hypothetical protein
MKNISSGDLGRFSELAAKGLRDPSAVTPTDNPSTRPSATGGVQTQNVYVNEITFKDIRKASNFWEAILFLFGKLRGTLTSNETLMLDTELLFKAMEATKNINETFALRTIDQGRGYLSVQDRQDMAKEGDLRSSLNKLIEKYNRIDDNNAKFEISNNLTVAQLEDRLKVCQKSAEKSRAKHLLNDIDVQLQKLRNLTERMESHEIASHEIFSSASDLYVISAHEHVANQLRSIYGDLFAAKIENFPTNKDSLTKEFVAHMNVGNVLEKYLAAKKITQSGDKYVYDGSHRNKGTSISSNEQKIIRTLKDAASLMRKVADTQDPARGIKILDQQINELRQKLINASATTGNKNGTKSKTSQDALVEAKTQREKYCSDKKIKNGKYTENGDEGRVKGNPIGSQDEANLANFDKIMRLLQQKIRVEEEIKHPSVQGIFSHASKKNRDAMANNLAAYGTHVDPSKKAGMAEDDQAGTGGSDTDQSNPKGAIPTQKSGFIPIAVHNANSNEDAKGDEDSEDSELDKGDEGAKDDKGSGGTDPAENAKDVKGSGDATQVDKPTKENSNDPANAEEAKKHNFDIFDKQSPSSSPKVLPSPVGDTKKRTTVDPTGAKFVKEKRKHKRGAESPTTNLSKLWKHFKQVPINVEEKNDPFAPPPAKGDPKTDFEKQCDAAEQAAKQGKPADDPLKGSSGLTFEERVKEYSQSVVPFEDPFAASAVNQTQDDSDEALRAFRQPTTTAGGQPPVAINIPRRSKKGAANPPAASNAPAKKAAVSSVIPPIAPDAAKKPAAEPPPEKPQPSPEKNTGGNPK